MLAHRQQVAGRQNVTLAGQGRLLGIAMRNQQTPLILPGRQHSRQYTLERPQCTIKGQFAQKFAIGKTLHRDLSRGCQNAQSDGQIEPTSLLGKIGRRKINGDSAGRKLEAGVQESAPNALLAFSDTGFRQAHDRERRQTAGKMDLDGNGRR